MRQARGLVPYAAFAVFVVGATVVALVLTTLAGPQGAPAAASASPSASPTPAARATADLSVTGRLAYWRSEPNGDHLLWLANADNSRRRAVAKADQPNAVSRTRWSPDGSSVAYVEGGVRLVVVRVDGVNTSYTLAPELRADGYRIVDSRSSPSGARHAATVQRTNGARSDVYVTAAGGTWTRLTTTEDVMVASWISEDELLVQTTGGIVGRLRAAGRDQLRPLTGLASATPIVGDDGRVHFLSGRVAGFTASNETLVFAASSSVWSATADGEDLRREGIALGTDSYRLDGVWPGGGYLLHRGTNPAQVLVGKEGTLDLPTSGGLIERLEVSADRRFAIGFAGQNIVRLDLAANGTVANLVVLLGTVDQADAWFPRTVTLARVTPAASDVPAARYAFALGGHLWTMGPDGHPALLRAGSTNAQTLRRFALPAPRWSPTGDRVLTAESLAAGASAFQLVAVVISRDGTARRYTTPSSVSTTLTWSPDGTRFALTAFPASTIDPAMLLASDLSIPLVDASSGTVTSTIPGREAFWTQAGVVVLGNGTFRAGDRARDEQAIELWANNGQKRAVATIATLVADPRVQAPAQTRGVTQAGGLSASSDGAYAAVHLAFLGATTSPAPALVVVRTRDGTPTLVVSEGVSDEAWAPNGRLVGYTIALPQPSGAPRQHAIVRDAETGDVVEDVDGRFAGWSPDAAWTYVARPEGLFARRLAGGDPVRFSPYGVVVAVTTP